MNLIYYLFSINKNKLKTRKKRAGKRRKGRKSSRKRFSLFDFVQIFMVLFCVKLNLRNTFLFALDEIWKE